MRSTSRRSCARRCSPAGALANGIGCRAGRRAEETDAVGASLAEASPRPSSRGGRAARLGRRHVRPGRRPDDPLGRGRPRPACRSAATRRCSTRAADRAASRSSCGAPAATATWSRSTRRRRWSRPRASGWRRSATACRTSSRTSARRSRSTRRSTRSCRPRRSTGSPTTTRCSGTSPRVLRPGGRLVAQCGGRATSPASAGDRRRPATDGAGPGPSPRPTRRAPPRGRRVHRHRGVAPRRAHAVEPGEPLRGVPADRRPGRAPGAPGARAERDAFVEAVAAACPDAMIDYVRLNIVAGGRAADRRGRQRSTRNGPRGPGSRCRPRRGPGRGGSSTPGPDRIDRRPVRAPPQVRHRVHAVVGLHDERRVLLGVTRASARSSTAASLRSRRRRGRATGRPCSAPRSRTPRRSGTARRSSCGPGGGGRGTLRHRLGRRPAPQRVEDQRSPGDHPRVDDDQRVAVADERRTTRSPA